MSSPSRDSAKTAHKGKRRSLFGRIGRVFRRLLRHGKKKEVVSDPGEINAIPPETTNGEDIVPTSEKETEAKRGTEYVHASEINIGPTSGTDSAHQQISEELEFTTSESDQNSELQSTNATNIVVASEKETEATKGTEHGHASEINIGPTSGTDSAHQQTAEELEFTTSESDQKSEILSTNATDIVETVPNPAGGTESTSATESDTSSDGTFVSADDMEFTRVLETVAELKDGKETNTSTETLSIPESGIESSATTNEESDSEDITQSTDATDIEEVVPNSKFGTLVTIIKILTELNNELEISSSTKSVFVGGCHKFSWSICLRRHTETTDSSDGIPEGGGASAEGTDFTTIEGTAPASRDGSGSTTSDESETSLASETESTVSSDSVYVSAEEPEFTPCIDDVDAPTDELEVSIPTETIPESLIEITATLDNVPESEDTIQPTKATDIVETVPTSTDGMESTVVENVAELKDGMDISIPSETASIPESVTEIVATTDIVSASETKAEVISSTDNALDYAALRKESVPPLTTQKEPAEDKPRPSGGSVQHAQQNATPGGKRRFFFSKTSDIRIRKGAFSKGTDQIKADVPVPLTVDSFKYHKLLGEGLYGKVFLASHPATDQLLAIKKVKKMSAPLDRLLAERQVQEMMGGNRFFPELYATFQTKEYLFYVMEYVNGSTLEEFVIKMQPLDISTIRFIAAELLCSIQALHSRGIVHRDLHVHNILIDSTGHVKIIDFGLSKKKELPYNPDITAITTTMALVEPWYDYLSEYLSFRHILVYLLLNAPSNDQRNPQLDDLIQECKCVRRNLRQHPFFAGINWKKLVAGNVRPPYHMAPVPEVNRSKRIRVKGKRFMKRRRRRPTIDVPGFEFVSNRWREMLQHH